MTPAEIRRTEGYKAEKANIKRHGGFNLVGKYKMTDEEIVKWLENAIRVTEVQLQAMKDMLEEKDFH